MSEPRADPQQEPQTLKRLHVCWRRTDDKLGCSERGRKKNAGIGRKQSGEEKEGECTLYRIQSSKMYFLKS